MEKNKGKIRAIIIGILLLCVIAVVAIIIWYKSSLTGVGNREDVVNVDIPLGSYANDIANILKEDNLIKSKIAFKIYLKLNNVKTFQAGSYKIDKGMAVPEIVEVLQTGKVLKEAEVKITFIEGKPFTYIAKQIAENTNNTEEDVYNTLKDEEYLDSLIDKYWFITDEIKNEKIYYPLEGYLFPDTYEFEEKTVTVKEIFEKLLDQMGKVLDNYKEELQANKYTVHEILSMASIIENEGLLDNDRKDIASVLYNRLKRNESLGCDATTYYGLKIELGSRELYQRELDAENSYNTRGPNMNGKLPVGPICAPGKESIEAAIHPNNTDYLFYVTDKNGKAYFTKTSSEHQKTINTLKANNMWAEF